MAEQRKLVTIMALDVAGYSRASEKDDSAMAAAVGRLHSVIADAIAPHGGADRAASRRRDSFDKR